MRPLSLSVSFLILFLFNVCYNSNGPIVSTPFGNVLGGSNGIAEYFLGIPYANSNRWENPIDWNEKYDNMTFTATEYGPICAQVNQDSFPDDVIDMNITYSEQCNSLNIFRPLKIDSSAKLPVIVFIHGGGFYIGSTMRFNASSLATSIESQPVIAVTINYRLGALGFFANQELYNENPSNGYGNFGLLDQQSALRWIKTNIQQFGGDPTRVTIAGQSAGAISVLLHYVMSGSENLFSNGIVMSSNGLPSDTLPLNSALQVGKNISTALNCSVSDLNCLRSKSWQEVVKAWPNQVLTTPASPYWSYMPVNDGINLPIDVHQNFLNGDFYKKPMMAGSCLNDSSAMTMGDYGSYFDLPPTQNISSTGYTNYIDNKFPDSSSAIINMYPPPISGYSNSNGIELGILFTDDYNFCSTRRIIRSFVKYNLEPYWWVFSKQPSCALDQNIEYGVVHGSDLQFIFVDEPATSGKKINCTMSQDDLTVSTTLTQYWTSFAYTNSPNSNSPVGWAPYTSTDSQTNNINVTPVMIRDFENVQCNFWDSYLGIS
eukprot:TRINITY_DN7083_c0_g1_i1.p1 TRINITY_DN7083_c0_g1~~TRINITY_DN7083_c0_g1_i1.p1  ORF type:complete len:544 (+),score=154.15 TRINITY_DN7083_c0_g1_i1:32-1663(+)